jgi:hypothetical protein
MVYCVKWVISWWLRRASREPWKLATVYRNEPKTVKRRVGLVLSMEKTPRMVMWWLMATVMTGINIIMEPTTPTVMVQAEGAAGEVVGSGPVVEDRQSPEARAVTGDNYERAAGDFGNQIVGRGDRDGGDPEAEGVVAEPPVGDGL